jgi:hypothetical protein
MKARIKGTKKTIEVEVLRPRMYRQKDKHGRVVEDFEEDELELLQELTLSTSDHWQEQDNTMAFTLMRDIEQVSFISKEGKDERISWLNSLEDRFSNQESNKDHWQDVRERAAIAAMQCIIKELYEEKSYTLEEEKVARYSVCYADALVKKLKGE